MKGQWHLDRNGNPAACYATVRDCPLGGAHFNSRKEADHASEVFHARKALEERGRLIALTHNHDDNTDTGQSISAAESAKKALETRRQRLEQRQRDKGTPITQTESQEAARKALENWYRRLEQKQQSTRNRSVDANSDGNDMSRSGSNGTEWIRRAMERRRRALQEHNPYLNEQPIDTPRATGRRHQSTSVRRPELDIRHADSDDMYEALQSMTSNGSTLEAADAESDARLGEKIRQESRRYEDNVRNDRSRNEELSKSMEEYMDLNASANTLSWMSEQLGSSSADLHDDEEMQALYSEAERLHDDKGMSWTAATWEALHSVGDTSSFDRTSLPKPWYGGGSDYGGDIAIASRRARRAYRMAYVLRDVTMSAYGDNGSDAYDDYDDYENNRNVPLGWGMYE